MASWDWCGSLTDHLQKRVGRYLLNRHLGPLLEGGKGILANQMSVEADVNVRNVALSVDNINDMLREQELPIELVDG